MLRIQITREDYVFEFKKNPKKGIIFLYDV